MKCIRVRNKIQIVKLKVERRKYFFSFVVLFNFKPIFLLHGIVCCHTIVTMKV